MLEVSQVCACEKRQGSGAEKPWILAAVDAIEEFAPCILCEVCFEDRGQVTGCESIVHAKDAMHASNCVKHLKKTHNIHGNAPDSAEHNEFGTLLPQKRMASDETASTLTVGQGKRQATEAVPTNMMSQSTLNQSMFQTSDDSQIECVHLKIVEFANCNDVSQYTICSDTFQEMYDTIIDNAAVLKRNRHRGKKIYMKWDRCYKLRNKQLETLYAGMAVYIAETREYWLTVVGHCIAFVTVGHDIWESHGSEILGVTLFFYNPVRAISLCIPIGLARCWSKASKPCADQTLQLLNNLSIREKRHFQVCQ